MPFLSSFRRTAVASMALAALYGLVPDGALADALPVRDPYRINPGDVLQISVWKETDLQRELLVNPDGHIAFPLADDLVAEGKTVEQLRVEITEKLARFIPDVVVTVAALQVSGNKVYVLGQVARPGEFVMTRTADVMQAISAAGGTTPFAQRDDIKILRRGEQGTQIAIPFKYGDVEAGRKLEQNILLRAGDTIVVP